MLPCPRKFRIASASRKGWFACPSASKTSKTSSPTSTRRCFMFSYAIAQPPQISGRALRNPKRDELRHIVTVQPLHFPFQFSEALRRRLHDQQILPRFLQLALPRVERFDGAHNKIDARCKPFANHRARYPPTFRHRPARDQNNSASPTPIHHCPSAKAASGPQTKALPDGEFRRQLLPFNFQLLTFNFQLFSV